MVRRYVLLAFAITLLAGTGLVGRHQDPETGTLTAVGHVSMVTSLDGLTTAVSIDIGGPRQPPDGLVDHAFRLQLEAPQALAYDGVAAIIYTGTELRIAVDDQVRWLFSVDSTDAVPSDVSQPYASFVVNGLSHHWGGRIHAQAQDVANLLLASGCLATSDPSCDSCEAGGPGVDGCGVECDGGSGCSARCGPGSFACCNCPGGCRCCPSLPQRLTDHQHLRQ
jgi:hypothetical protein